VNAINAILVLAFRLVFRFSSYLAPPLKLVLALQLETSGSRSVKLRMANAPLSEHYPLYLKMYSYKQWMKYTLRIKQVCRYLCLSSMILS
jgi:hypothetical protein